MQRWRRLGSALTRWTLYAVLAVVLLLAGAGGLSQTAWGRDELRRFIVSQANRYLTATLEIGQLQGSLLRGIELDVVRLSRNGETLISVDHVAVDYSIRELAGIGTQVRRLVLTRPHVVVAKDADGRWNLASLVKRDPARPPAAGPGRTVTLSHIEVVDGSVVLRDELTFGDAHVPSGFTGLNATLSLSYAARTLTLDFERAAFSGSAPNLEVRELRGVIAGGDEGWRFDKLSVSTPRSAFTLDGRIDRRQTPSLLDLRVAAPRLAFQEWAGVLHGLGNLAVESALDATLTGPPSALHTTFNVRSNGGDVRADLVLDSSVPGWHAKGDATVQRLDLARWLNRVDRPSDISGAVALDIDLDLGGHFPRGSFQFRGSHAGYLEYEADDVVARGTITATEVRLASVTATAYGANVRLKDSTLAIDEPYPFRFIGTAAGVDLRLVPRDVPVPHVESTLAFDYDVTGQFAEPFLKGSATFADSDFLGATLGAGATGAIDTEAVPFHYSGEGDLRNVDLNHFGDRLDIAWLTEPRYNGTVRGHFHVDGLGSELATMQVTGGGRLDEANLFGGRLSNADVSVAIANGSLDGTYDGQLTRVDPSIPMGDAVYTATLTGHTRARMAVRDLMVRSPELNDYTVDATMSVSDSVVRDIEVTRGEVQARIASGTLQLERLVTAGPGADLEAHGTLEIDGVRSSRLDYDVKRGDLSKLRALIGRDVSGQFVTAGQMTGPLDRPHLKGDGTLNGLGAQGLVAGTATASYDITIPRDDPAKAVGSLKAHLSTLHVSGQDLQAVNVDLAADAGQLVVKLDGTLPSGEAAALTGSGLLDLTARRFSVAALTLDARGTSWRLAAGTRSVFTWTDVALSVDELRLVDAQTGAQQLSASGAWDDLGSGRLRLAARGIVLDPFTAVGGGVVRYSGLFDIDAIVSGTREQPVVSADFTVHKGRVRRLSYESVGGHVDYKGDALQLDVRLDQAPGVWLTVSGALPLAAFDPRAPAQPLRLTLKSSRVGLALLEGVTDLVRNVGGQMELDVVVLGTTRDPHFEGRVQLTDASFDVVASGAKYRNGRLALALASDRVGVETLHLEDESGHGLDVTGSLGTHELRVGDLQVAVNARGFQVLRNEFGRIDLDARLDLTGEFESPRLRGSVTVSGGSLNVDRILDRAMFQPYATQQTPLPELDPIVALNPWDRMGLDVELHVPGTLRLIGDNVQVSSGTPLGLGNINLRAFGDLYLYKDPQQPMYVNGSFDSVTGTYAFQGRRFDLDQASSINFHGDLNPDLYVTVNRVISGVETRVSIVGPMAQPELRLASTPPLDPSDILSLIVFNTSTNELSALQQQQLAVRAGTLAAGFIAAPMVSALERTLGIDTLEIEPGADIRGGPRVTVGNELAPGLVARFSRQFGEFDYDEATLEYYLSRILRIRATFSDAGTLTARSPFRRVERAGIDLLLFFSF